MSELKRVCSICETEKFITEFRKRKNSPTGYNPVCKVCYNKKELNRKKSKPPTDEQRAQHKYRQTQKYFTTSWKNHLNRKYGISLQEYEELLTLQNYSCKICGSKKANRDWKERQQRVDLFVDHCHKTNKVRGLLCNTCNAGIGMLKDDINILTAAINYLKENE